MKSSTNTLIDAMKILASEIQSQDGVANVAILEASERLNELMDKVAELEQELQKSTDQNDLVLDEFVRVKCLTDNTEIHALCERAHIRMRQNVSVIDRNYKLEVKAKELEQENKKLRERNRKLDVDLLRGLFYAPSSPVSAKKAQEIEVWYGKFKQVQLASKGGAE